MTAPDGWSSEQVEAASVAEIAAGRLPMRAQWRIAEMRARSSAGTPGAYTSALSTGEFAAIRSVGFSPVGQVLGCAVFQIGFPYTDCGFRGSNGASTGAAPVVAVPSVARVIESARRRAVDRLRAECAGLGGDGVVGVHLKVRSFYGNGLEFAAIGTAVRADGSTRARTAFTSDLSGQEFAKLLRAGWVPVDLIQGVGAMIRHDDFNQRISRSAWSNLEFTGMTAVVTAARNAARQSLRADATKRGAEGVVLTDMELKLSEVPCAVTGDDATDHVCYAVAWGTAIARIGGAERADGPEMPLAMMRLDGRTGVPTQRR